MVEFQKAYLGFKNASLFRVDEIELRNLIRWRQRPY